MTAKTERTPMIADVPGAVECIAYLTLAIVFGLVAIWPADPNWKP